MNRLLRRFLTPSKEDPFSRSRFTTKPIAKWKKNIFSVVSGLCIGLYIGQYFPDVYYPMF